MLLKFLKQYVFIKEQLKDEDKHKGRKQYINCNPCMTYCHHSDAAIAILLY
jgi:t-SNARE complex subunit (syntaxin)